MKDKRKIRECALSSSFQWGTQLRRWWMPTFPVSSQERAAEETALLGLFCNLYPLTAALRVVALLKYTQMRNHIQK